MQLGWTRSSSGTGQMDPEHSLLIFFMQYLLLKDRRTLSTQIFHSAFKEWHNVIVQVMILMGELMNILF